MNGLMRQALKGEEHRAEGDQFVTESADKFTICICLATAFFPPKYGFFPIQKTDMKRYSGNGASSPDHKKIMNECI